MLSCHQATRLLSDSQERSLRLSERMTMRMHLLMCDGCRNFERQMGVIRLAMRKMASDDDSPQAGPGDHRP